MKQQNGNRSRGLTVAGIIMLGLVSCSHLKLDQPIKSEKAPWPTDGRNPERTNASPEIVVPPLHLAWTNDVTGGIGSGSPLVVDGLLIVGTLRGELHVIDASTGKRRGWIDLFDAIHGSPAIEGNIVFVAGSNSSESLIAFDMLEGKPRWKRSYGHIEVSPMLADGDLYFGNTKGEFYAVSAASGDKLWKFQLPENTRLKGIRSSAALAESTVVFGADDGSVYALHRTNGRMVWKYSTGHPVVAGPTIADGSVLASNLGGLFCSINARTGRLNWSRTLGKSIHGGAAIADGTAIIGTTDGYLFSIGLKDGKVIWSVDLGSVVNSSAVISGDYAYVGTLSKILYGIKRSNGEVVFKTIVPGRIKSAPAIAYGNLYVASDERMILAFAQGAGE